MPISIDEIKSNSLDFNQDKYAEVFDAYIADLNNFIANTAEQSNVAKNYFINTLVDKWQYILGFNRNQILQDIADLQTPISETVKTLSVKEALQYHSSTASWLVPNILRSSGLYILAGEPKTGKSLLVYFLMYAVSVSGKFLGRPVKKGKVLYIQLEESISTVAERLFYCGFGNAFDDETSLSVNFGDTLLIEREFDLTMDLDWLVKRIEEYKPALVVIDSLRMASINSPYSENSNEFGKLIYRLQKVFNHTDVCGVLIHHMNKLGSRSQKTSLIERMSGHTSISAANSGLIGIHREDTEQGPLIVLKTLPRDGSPITLTYCLKTASNGMWELEKIWEDTPIGEPITGKILRFLYQQLVEQGENACFLDKEIAEAISVPVNNSQFKKCLEFLTGSQLIGSRYKSGVFKYFLPLENEWLVNSRSIKESLDSSVIDANSIIRCQDKRDLQTLLKDWERDRINKAIAYLLPKEKERIDSMASSAYYDVGEKVIFENNIYTVIEILSSKITLYRTQYLLRGENAEEVEALEVDIHPYVEPEVKDDLVPYELDISELENVHEIVSSELNEEENDFSDEDLEDLFE